MGSQDVCAAFRHEGIILGHNILSDREWSAAIADNAAADNADKADNVSHGQAVAIRLPDELGPDEAADFRLLIGPVRDVVDRLDPWTTCHSWRVAAFAVRLAQQARVPFPPSQLAVLKYAALLHDIGKIAVSQALLDKPGGLTAAERIMIESHPLHGAALLTPLDLDPLIRDVVLHHHENYDGSGYPGRLKGDAIPLAARIVRLADVYEALTSDRPYRAAFDRAQALAIIRRERRHFDPGLRVVLHDLVTTNLNTACEQSRPDEWGLVRELDQAWPNAAFSSPVSRATAWPIRPENTPDRSGVVAACTQPRQPETSSRFADEF